MAPQVGFEPTTNRLTADRSTTELLRSVEAASMGRRRTSECDGWLIVAPAHLPRQRKVTPFSWEGGTGMGPLQTLSWHGPAGP